MQILTARCALTPLSEVDFEELAPLITDGKVREYLGGVRSLDKSLNEWRSGVQSTNKHLFTVRLHESNIAIGLVTVTPYHNPADMEISFTLIPKYWGVGYAQEAVKGLLQFCKSELQLKRVVSETQKANTRSRTMLEKLGYTLESETVRFGEVQCVYAFDFGEMLVQIS